MGSSPISVNSAWQDCKRILCIRPDNMGDLLMSTPAIRALKETFKAEITVLTSSMAAGIALHIPEIDHVITFDVPWVKNEFSTSEQEVFHIVDQLREQQFDAAVIFTVYTQNPIPTVMLAFMAGIPLRLAYCRENPYQLLTDWVPDLEPYTLIKHQVRRDLDLVTSVGAFTANEHLSLNSSPLALSNLNNIVSSQGLDISKPWLIVHAGVSEAKRQYPAKLWSEAINAICEQTGYQVVLTGSAADKELVETIYNNIIAKGQVYVMTGLLNLEEFIMLIQEAPVIISVNTGSIHIAAAVNTPVVVLYALTNPQHTPWNIPCQVLTFPVPPQAASKNEVIKYVNRFLNTKDQAMPNSTDIINAIHNLLDTKTNLPIEVNTSIDLNGTISAAWQMPDA